MSPPPPGIAAIPFQRSVFINCPFVAEFASLCDAIVFATVCCGFVPRSALESGTVAEPRLAGFDPATHTGTVATVVPTIMERLVTRPDAEVSPAPQSVLESLPAFSLTMAELRSAWNDTVPWKHVLHAAMQPVPKLSVGSGSAPGRRQWRSSVPHR